MSGLTMRSYVCGDTLSNYVPEVECECEMLESRVEDLEEGKQDKLTAGQYININSDNEISANISENYYNKDEVNELIGSIESIHFEVVNVLPEYGEDNIIYLLLNPDAEEEDVYLEFIWVNSAWERIGSTQIDLSNYYTKAEADNLLDDKQETLVSGVNIKSINGASLLGSGDISTEINIVQTEETLGDIGNVSSGTYQTLSATFTKTGFKPLALVGFYHDTRYFIDKYHVTSISASSITVGGYSTNWHNSAHTGVTVYVYILWQEL